MSAPFLIAVAAALAVGTQAQAQAPCAASPPAPGAVVRGPVLHVLDDETLCVALGATPDRWLPLRLIQDPLSPIDRGASSSRGALMSVAFGQDVTCRVIAVQAEPATAVCMRKGRSIARQARGTAAVMAARDWR